MRVARWCELLIESERVRASCLAPTRQVSTLVVCVLCDRKQKRGEMGPFPGVILQRWAHLFGDGPIYDITWAHLNFPFPRPLHVLFPRGTHPGRSWLVFFIGRGHLFTYRWSELGCGSWCCVGAPIGAPTGCFNAAAVQRRLVLRVRCRPAGCAVWSLRLSLRAVLRVSSPVGAEIGVLCR